MAESRLLTAAAAGDLALVSQLIGEGADVAHQDPQGMSALMHAADGGHVEVVKTLLEAGCPWNLQVSRSFGWMVWLILKVNGSKNG